jgi:hypothetical protein
LLACKRLRIHKRSEAVERYTRDRSVCRYSSLIHKGSKCLPILKPIADTLSDTQADLDRSTVLKKESSVDTRKFPRGKRHRIERIKDPPGVATLQSKFPRGALKVTPKSQKLLKRSRAVEATDCSVQLRDPMVYQANATINRPLCCRGSALKELPSNSSHRLAWTRRGFCSVAYSTKDHRNLNLHST